MKAVLRRVALPMLAVLLLCALAACSLLPQNPAPADDSSAASDASDTSGVQAGEGQDEARPLMAERGSGLYQPPADPKAEAVCIVNEETGLVVYERNSDKSLPAASLVKMMTCIIVMEQVEKFGWDLDATLVDSTNKTWIYDALYGLNASTADIRKGEILSLRELLYGALLPSGNEAAMLLADFACTGYMDNFYYMMRTRARKLGCTGTHFADVTGLSEESVTTARDMARITSAFMSYPELVEIAGTATYTMAAHEKHSSEYNIFTTNRLLVPSSPYYGKLGVAAGHLLAGKTGSIGDWQNFASKASKGGESYVCVVLHSPNLADTVYATIDPETNPRYRPALVEAAELYNWAFSTFTVSSALDVTQPVTELRVRYSTEADTVRLLPNGDVKAVLPKAGGIVQMRRVYDLPAEVSAPVEEGQAMGAVTLFIGSHEIGTVGLVSSRSVERNNVMYMMAEVGAFFTGTYFRVLVMLVLGCGVLYAAGLALVANSRARRRRLAPDGAPGPNGTKPAPKQAAGGRAKAAGKTAKKTARKPAENAGRRPAKRTVHKKQDAAQGRRPQAPPRRPPRDGDEPAVQVYVGGAGPGTRAPKAGGTAHTGSARRRGGERRTP